MGQAGGSFSLAGNALRLSLSASIFANVPYAEAPAGQPDLTNASATASITDWLDTGGPLRAGIVEITQELLNGDNSGGENSDGVNVSLDSVRGECTDSMCLEPVSAIQAVELGEPFELSGLANATGSACTGMCAGAADSSVSSSFTMEFFEADGVTPVNVFETIAPEVPVVTAEPGSWALLVVGLAGILGWGLLRRLVCRPV